MKKVSGMCVGLGLLAACAAGAAQAGSPMLTVSTMAAMAWGDSAADADKVETTRVKRVGTRLETVIVTAGAVDPDGKRFDDSGSAIAVLPTVSDDAFLDGDVTPAGSRP